MTDTERLKVMTDASNIKGFIRDRGAVVRYVLPWALVDVKPGENNVKLRLEGCKGYKVSDSAIYKRAKQKDISFTQHGSDYTLEDIWDAYLFLCAISNK